MYPILCKVRYEALHRTFRKKELWVQIAFSVFVNWIIAPLFMVRLSGMSFIHFLIFVTARACMGIPSRRRWPPGRSDYSRDSTLYRNGELNYQRHGGIEVSNIYRFSYGRALLEEIASTVPFLWRLTPYFK